eukprot:4676155-Prorocentrum_lima.AAC.1
MFGSFAFGQAAQPPSFSADGFQDGVVGMDTEDVDQNPYPGGAGFDRFQAMPEGPFPFHGFGSPSGTNLYGGWAFATSG